MWGEERGGLRMHGGRGEFEEPGEMRVSAFGDEG